MRKIDEQYLETPSYGRRTMAAHLKRIGYVVNHKRVSRLMSDMGIEAIYPKPKRAAWEQKYGKFPYLLRNVKIGTQNHVWGTDITYIPVGDGYLYLVAVIDLYSRYVLSWQLSNSLECGFCVEALERALEQGKPQILNSDQGVQFTSHDYVCLLKNEGIEISMSGKGRCWDNIFVERFWRSLKYEEVYLNQYCCSEEAYEGIGSYITLYNNKRPHSSLDYRTPSEVYRVA
jgi:putative transposase